MRLVTVVITSICWLIWYSPASADYCKSAKDGPNFCAAFCAAGQTASCKTNEGTNTCKCDGLPFSAELYSKDNVSPLGQPEVIIETNAAVKLNQRLASDRDFHLGVACHDEWRRDHCEFQPTLRECPIIVESAGELEIFCPREPRCDSRRVSICNNVFGKLQISGAPYPKVISTVNVHEPDWNGIPNEIIAYRRTYLNCYATPQEQTFRYQESVKVGSKVSKTKVVTEARDLTVEVSFSFAGIGGKGGAKFSRSVNVSTFNEETYEENKTLTEEFPIRIDPMTELAVTATWIKRVTPILFDGTVQVDANVVANREGITAVSQIVPNTAERTFEFAGKVSDTTLLEGHVEYRGRKLVQSECAKPGLFVSEGVGGD